MKLAYLLPLSLLAACADDNATKEESRRIFAAATSAMTSAQAKAVVEARDARYPLAQLVAPAQLTIDFAGACLFGGSVALQGTYAGSGADDRAAFDLAVDFHNCRELAGTIDGGLQWTSEANPSGFAVTMDGGLDWTDEDDAASCTVDLLLTVDASGIKYGGHLCGYNVATELVLGN